MGFVYISTGECVIIVMGAIYIIKPRILGTLNKLVYLY